VVSNFKDKGNKTLLTSIKRSVAIYNVANVNLKIQIMPLSFMEAASRLQYLHVELQSTVTMEDKLLADYCLKEINSNLSKDFPFLCIGLNSRDFFGEEYFHKRQLPGTGVFTRSVSIRDDGQECFIPTTQIDIEHKLARKLLPLWQKAMDPLEVDICARKFKLSSYHFVDPRNTTIKVGPDKAAAGERSNLDYIEPEYMFKDKLLRY
jgi:hypothetical protein